jgi:Putative transposase DNA-binding domain
VAAIAEKRLPSSRACTRRSRISGEIESARFGFVDPAYTSQTCFACGYVAVVNRSRLRLACEACHYVEHADVNAARMILLAWSGPRLTSLDAA